MSVLNYIVLVLNVTSVAKVLKSLAIFAQLREPDAVRVAARLLVLSMYLDPATSVRDFCVGTATAL